MQSANYTALTLQGPPLGAKRKTFSARAVYRGSAFEATSFAIELGASFLAVINKHIVCIALRNRRRLRDCANHSLYTQTRNMNLNFHNFRFIYKQGICEKLELQDIKYLDRLFYQKF